MRHLVAAALLATVATAGLSASRAEGGPLGRHPYFDDGGTLSWTTRVEDAQSAARSSNRLIFIEYGRKACGNCRTLVTLILPAESVRARISRLAVGLAAECDEPDPRIEALFEKNLQCAVMLPFVAVVTPDLQWVTGWSGSIDVRRICPHLS